jgi:DNA-binding CsgD family transcriptional regulator/GAF domain-containing protein
MTALLNDPRTTAASGCVPGWRRAEKDLLTRATFLSSAVRAAVDPAPGDADGLPEIDADEPWGCAGVLDMLTSRCIAALGATGAADRRAERLGRLLVDLQQLSLDLYRHERGLRSRRLADCAAGLSRLRTLPSSADLLDKVCEELVRRCGFGRAVLSRVSDGLWRPWMAHFSDGTEFDGWFAAWVDQPIALDDADPESWLLNERRPTLVPDTERTAVHRPIIVDAGHSRAYVAAPVIAGSEVVGFLHADHCPSGRGVDEVDRDVLWAFADGFGRIYERSVLVERLRAQRDHVRDALASTGEVLDRLCDSGIDLAWNPSGMPAGDQPGDGTSTTDPAVLRELTVREGQVLELMASGATNGAIAERLVIAEHTVKSHVKHILRKLGAVNRAQVIAMAAGVGKGPEARGRGGANGPSALR